MNLPQLPETTLKNKVEKFYTTEQMLAYGELCVKEYIKRQQQGLKPAKRKYDIVDIYQIRDMHLNGMGYKDVNRSYPMSRELFFRIVGHKGAYK